ncbi:MAG: ribosome recycling factor [Candidatus Paceibacterota bacterium]|jgi:ribosome recycling factor
MAYNLSNFKNEIKKVEEWLSKEYSQIHTGRASPIFLDSVFVESYGTLMAIKNIGSVSIEDPKTLRVSPWDKSQIKAVEKAIISANLGLSVVPDEAGLRVIFPMLTTENRTSIVKILKERLEDARISVRKEREKVWNDIQDKETAGSISEDDKFMAKDELQKIIDETNANLEVIFDKKEKEVMNQ